MTTWQGLVNRVLGASLAKFGEPVTYQPQGGSPVAMVGIFSNAHREIDPNSGAIVASNEPVLGVRLADFTTAPSKNDRMTVRGTIYRILDVQEDGEGGATLILQKTTG